MIEPAQLAAAGEQVNPNTATWASLARLPGIGPTHAKAIITYRQSHITDRGGGAVFADPQDLLKVPGIGPKTLEGIAPFLVFGPTTAPAAEK